MSNPKKNDNCINPVLEASTDSDLAPLVGYLKGKFSEVLTSNPKYKMYSPNHTQYADVIADEIRNMGGNSFSNLCRGLIGPSYYEIVCDVADKLKAPYKTSAEISIIEKSILETLLQKALDDMTEEEKTKLLNELESTGIDVGGLAASTLIALFRSGGFYSYQMAVIIANQTAYYLLGHGLSFAANAALTKSLSIMAGPIGIAFSGIWATIDLSGPAYSVTVPCVVHIAMLRIKVNSPHCSLCGVILTSNSAIKVCSKCADNNIEIVRQLELDEKFKDYHDDFIYNMYKRKNDLDGFERFIGAIEIFNKMREEELEIRRKNKEAKAKNRKKKRQKEAAALIAKSSVSAVFNKQLNNFIDKS